MLAVALPAVYRFAESGRGPLLLIPVWAGVIVSLIITALFVLGVFGLAASPYGDWVREFYARRDRLQTLFGDKKKPEDKPKRG